ncbi:MAG: hypothetical protein LLF83_07245 [Methanobacterium sp.]|nr:hypothetical protein [Methanobacterium sp.]
MRSPNQKYCHPDTKNCSKESKRDSWRKAAYKYREKYKKVIHIPQVYKLGSGWLGSKAEADFEEEYYSIQKEKKRLRINSIIAGVFIWVQLNNQFFIRNFLTRNEISLDLSPELIIFFVIVLTFIFLGINYR